jgi:DNA-directed RNA polymerase subunit K
VVILFSYDDYTRFETTRIISARTLQIAMGAPPLIKTSASRSQDIAKEEFKKNVLPITVKRMIGEKS